MATVNAMRTSKIIPTFQDVVAKVKSLTLLMKEVKWL